MRRADLGTLDEEDCESNGANSEEGRNRFACAAGSRRASLPGLRGVSVGRRVRRDRAGCGSRGVAASRKDDRRGGGLGARGGGKGGRRCSGVGSLRAHSAAGTEGLDSDRALLREHWEVKTMISGSQGRLVGGERGRTWADLGVVSAHAVGALLQKSDVAVGARALDIRFDVVLVVRRARLRAVGCQLADRSAPGGDAR